MRSWNGCCSSCARSLAVLFQGQRLARRHLFRHHSCGIAMVEAVACTHNRQDAILATVWYCHKGGYIPSWRTPWGPFPSLRQTRVLFSWLVGPGARQQKEEEGDSRPKKRGGWTGVRSRLSFVLSCMCLPPKRAPRSTPATKCLILLPTQPSRPHQHLLLLPQLLLPPLLIYSSCHSRYASSYRHSR